MKIGNKNVSVAKTIHVDFQAKTVSKIEEMEYTGSLVYPGPVTESFPAWGVGKMPPMPGSNAPGLKVDPARLIESAIQSFEFTCNDLGLYDDSQYRNPQVLFDALETFAILQREIPMLVDTMENLREMIIAETGVDPALRSRVGKK